ncbi:MAG: hypothetical protein K9N06_09035 [Candidatus Cloacimonetes bacterium]|nr:hypothetical protein [Candidatus Cloacimonadota bacterium]
MNTFMAILLITVFAYALTAAEFTGAINVDRSPSGNTGRDGREFITIYEEDFENGADDWEHYDASSTDGWLEAWHISPAGAYSGNSWWMGDEELGGYTDHRYLVLDTPEITLSALDPTLSFMFSLCCENPGGEPPYNAWDGANVRISTDGGNTWEVISGLPAYNGDSFYSFGYVFDEGEGIPGWGSLTEWVNWTSASFDLSAYNGQEVKIRFAFASDTVYNTIDDENMFGFRIDNIVIDTAEGTFESDGDGAQGDMQMIPGHGVSAVGDLWHIYEDSEAPSGTHAMGCFDDSSNTYLPDMDDYIISPEFYLPEEGRFYWNVHVQTMLDVGGTYPDRDYLHFEICSQIPNGDWTPWYNISCPTGSASGTEVFYWESTSEWTLFTDVWEEWLSSITMLAGRNIKFRFGLHSNETDEPVPGGFRIDDLIVIQEIYAGPPPENLIAMVNPLNEVEISWDPVNSPDREVTGYNIWRTNVSGEDYENIGTIDPLLTPYFLDEDPVEGSWNYYVVTALFDGVDGEGSNEAADYVMSSSDTELAYDDGTCEEGINVGIAQYMAVRFITPSPTEIVLNYIRFYIETLNTGQVVFRIFEDDNGHPGDQVAQFLITPDEMHTGWNTVEIPPDQINTFADGCFFISILEMPNLSAIGKDTDNSGNSWITTGPDRVWEELTDGNIMIRAIIFYENQDTEPVEIMPSAIALNVYPNPFNPETTISFSTTTSLRGTTTWQAEGTENTELSIYNVKGQKVRQWTMDDGQWMMNGGRRSVVWDGKDDAGKVVSGGIYFILLKTETFTQTRKVVLLK